MSAEFAVMGETPHGKTITIRRGFTSEEAAEDWPIIMKQWRRVWVELVAGEVPRKPGPRPRREVRA